MSDDEKLSLPPFEQMASGFRFGTDVIDYPRDHLLESDMLYETVFVDPTMNGERTQAVPYRVSTAVMENLVGGGAAGQAAIRHTGTSRYLSADSSVASRNGK